MPIFSSKQLLKTPPKTVKTPNRIFCRLTSKYNYTHLNNCILPKQRANKSFPFKINAQRLDGIFVRESERERERDKEKEREKKRDRERYIDR